LQTRFSTFYYFPHGFLFCVLEDYTSCHFTLKYNLENINKSFMLIKWLCMRSYVTLGIRLLLILFTIYRAVEVHFVSTSIFANNDNINNNKNVLIIFKIILLLDWWL